MSEKPVAWVVAEEWKYFQKFGRADVSLYNCQQESFCGKPYDSVALYSQSPAEVRALAIAECARMVERWEATYDGAESDLSLLADDIRALSPAPSVTQAQVDAIWETVRDKSKECDDPSEAAMWGIRATLAVLGVEVKS